MKILAPASLALAAALVFAASVGSQPTPSAPKPPPKPAQACFWAREADGFSAPDDQTLYVRVSVRDVYRLKLFGNCMDISWVHHIGLATHGMSDICEGPNPDVDVIDRETGIGRQRCPVTDVHKMTPDEIAALPKNERP
jgi:Family of unknown function (DUF6491)